MTLLEMKKKIKSASEKLNSKDFFFAAVILLVGFASFGFGRLSKLSETREPVKVEQASLAVITAGGKVVASKSGTKYHFPWCAGASQISEKNKIFFSSIEEARKSGYTPASNCKGLK